MNFRGNDSALKERHRAFDVARTDVGFPDRSGHKDDLVMSQSIGNDERAPGFVEGGGGGDDLKVIVVIDEGTVVVGEQGAWESKTASLGGFGLAVPGGCGISLSGRRSGAQPPGRHGETQRCAATAPPSSLSLNPHLLAMAGVFETIFLTFWLSISLAVSLLISVPLSGALVRLRGELLALFHGCDAR